MFSTDIYSFSSKIVTYYQVCVCCISLEKMFKDFVNCRKYFLVSCFSVNLQGSPFKRVLRIKETIYFITKSLVFYKRNKTRSYSLKQHEGVFLIG